MARIAKALVTPEHGYAHREHRSKKGRMQDYRYIKARKRKLQKLKELTERERGERKGKWNF